MSDYTPVFLPGEKVSLTLTANCKGGDLMVVTGQNAVAPFTPSGTPAENYVGVASADQNSGLRVGVYCRGQVHESLADGTVTAGDQITTAQNANRQVKTLAVTAQDVTGTPTQGTINTAINGAVNGARSVIGIALTTAADNQKVRWMAIN